MTTNPGSIDPTLNVLQAGREPAAVFSGGNVVVNGGSFVVDGTALNVPDYVFEDSYRLMTLNELSQFIEANGHLPNIPSAEEVAIRGLDYSEFTLGLLEKVEELTLHTITLNERVEAQQRQIDELFKRLDAVASQE